MVLVLGVAGRFDTREGGLNGIGELILQLAYRRRTNVRSSLTTIYTIEFIREGLRADACQA